MERKTRNLFNQIKSMTLGEVLKKIKKNQKKLTPEGVAGIARKAIDSARDLSREEVKVLLGKFNDIKDKTNIEVEKIVETALKKLFKDLPSDMATAEVRKEIAHMLVEHNRKTLFSTMKYLNNVVVRNMPTSFWAAKNFRKNVAKNLVKDAQKRINARNKSSHKEDK